MVVVRRRDQHGVDLRQREQLAVVGDAHDAAVGALLAQRLAPRRERRLMRVSDRDDLALGNQVQVAQVLLANAARADDAEADDAWRLGERRRERLEQRERHAAAAERLRHSSAAGWPRQLPGKLLLADFAGQPGGLPKLLGRRNVTVSGHTLHVTTPSARRSLWGWRCWR